MATIEVDQDTIVLKSSEYRRLYVDVLRLRSQLLFLYERDGECPGDHPDWMKRIKALLDETAAHELIKG